MAELNFDVAAFEQAHSAQAAPAPQPTAWNGASDMDSKLASIAASTQQQLMAINFNAPEEQHVLTFLTALHAAMLAQGVPALPVEQFYSTDAFERWKLLLADELAEGCKTPPNFNAIMPTSIFVRALTPFRCDKLNMEVVTFADRVQRAAELKMLWLSEHDTSGKRAKLNREAQRRYQLRQKDDGSPEAEQAKAAKAAYEEYIEACKQRKEAEAQWDEYVKQVTEQARAQRAHTMAQWTLHVSQKKQAWEDIKAQKPLN